MSVARRASVIVVFALVGFVASTPAIAREVDTVRLADDRSALVAGRDALMPVATRLEPEQRENIGSSRAAKYLLIFAMVFAALVSAKRLDSRRIDWGAALHPLPSRWSFRAGGRAPPLFQPSLV